MDLVGHVIDLKLPWLLGHSGAVAKMADAIAATMGVATEKRVRLRRAAWLHGIGRVSVPNAIWDRKGPLTTGDMERVRLAPLDIASRQHGCRTGKRLRNGCPCL